MKYLVVLTDGAGDYPIEELGGKTPIEAADIENINALAAKGEIGMVKTIPDGIAPGSDAANLSVMGYDPSIYLTGRSPLEAASIGIEMTDTDVSFRANLVTLTGDGEYSELVIADHSSGDISTAEADELIKAINEEFQTDEIKFYTGTSYRHCLIVKNGTAKQKLIPPHDILEKKVGEYLPSGENSEFLRDMMIRSYKILKEHPVNKKRAAEGKNQANSPWIWGEGTKPKLKKFFERYGITGTAISAVDLIKGIAIFAGLDSRDVEGATGTVDTNYEGKAAAAIDEFSKGKDFVYIHLEGPDECSHQGDLKGKLTCLSRIDKIIVDKVHKYLEDCGEDYKILVVPDHRTPVSLRTHSPEPVPFVLYDSGKDIEFSDEKKYGEKYAENGRYFGSGVELADYFFAG